MKQDLLESALKVLETLNEKGFEAYIVGGFVRDKILGRESKDIDITTNAVPDVVQAIFKKNYNKSAKFKTITVIVDGYEFEITTFRKDLKYKDHRHPISKVTSSLKTDIKRRDFTVNAMCMDKDLKIYDYVNGENDVKLHLLRAVGKPKRRFNEDALRMFRAFRFASVLGFKIEPKTYMGIRKNVKLVPLISKERIRAELEETITGSSFKDVLPSIIESDIFSSLKDIDRALVYLNENYKTFDFMDLMCLASYIKGSVTEDLILSKKEIKFIKETLYFAGLIKKREIKPELLLDRDYDALKEGIKILSLMRETPYKIEDIDVMYNDMVIKSSKDLKIKGDEIIANLDITDQTLIKEYLRKLAVAVVLKKVPNDNEKLIEYVKGL